MKEAGDVLITAMRGSDLYLVEEISGDSNAFPSCLHILAGRDAAVAGAKTLVGTSGHIFLREVDAQGAGRPVRASEPVRGGGRDQDNVSVFKRP